MSCDDINDDSDCTFSNIQMRLFNDSYLFAHKNVTDYRCDGNPSYCRAAYYECEYIEPSEDDTDDASDRQNLFIIINACVCLASIIRAAL